MDIYEEGAYPEDFNLVEEADESPEVIAEDEELEDIYPADYDLLADDDILPEDYYLDEEDYDEEGEEEDDEDAVLVESDLDIDPEEDVSEVEADDPVLVMLSVIDDIADLECQLESAQNSDLLDNFSELELEERQIIEELIYEKNELLIAMEKNLTEEDLEIWVDVVKEKPLKKEMLKNKPDVKLNLALQIKALQDETAKIEATSRKEHKLNFMDDEITKITEDIAYCEELHKEGQIDLAGFYSYAADCEARIAAVSGRRVRPAPVSHRAWLAAKAKKAKASGVPAPRRPTIAAPPRLADVQQAQRRASVRRVSLMVQARNDAAVRSKSISVAAAALRPKVSSPRPKRVPIVIPARIDPAAENRRRVRKLVTARNDYATSTKAYIEETVPRHAATEAAKKEAVVATVKKLKRVQGVKVARKTAADKKNRDVHVGGTAPVSAVAQADKRAEAIVKQMEIERQLNIKIARDKRAAKEVRNAHVANNAILSPRVAAMKKEKIEAKKEEEEKVEKKVAARKIDATEFVEAVAPVSARVRKAKKVLVAREMARTKRVQTMVAAKKVEQGHLSTAKAPKCAVAEADKQAAQAKKEEEEVQTLVLSEARKKWASRTMRSAFAKGTAPVSPRVAAMKQEKADAKKEEEEKVETKVAARKVDTLKFSGGKAPKSAKAEAAKKVEKERQHGLAKVVEKLKEAKKQYSKKEYIPKVKRPVVTALKPNRGPAADPNEGQASFSTMWALKRIAEQDAELVKARRTAEMLAQAANKFSLPHRRNSELTRKERVEAMNQKFALENVKRQEELAEQLEWINGGIEVEDLEDSDLDEFLQYEREQAYLYGEKDANF